MTGRDAERDDLVAALAGLPRAEWDGAREAERLRTVHGPAVDRLLPVVDRIANERAAAAEQRGYERGRRELAAYLNRIAPALRASNGAGTT